MRRARRRRRFHPVSLTLFVVVIGSGVRPATGVAAEWQISPSLSVGEAYNDNINLSTNGTKKLSDFITTVSPDLRVTGVGQRLQLNFEYSPELLLYMRGNGSNGVQQTLLGVGNLEAIQDTLFLNAKASVSEQFLNTAGSVSTSTLTNSNNLQTVQTYQVGPDFRHHFGSYANLDSSVTYTAVRSGGGVLSDSDAVESKAQLSSGEYFGRLGWTLTGDDQETHRSSLSSASSVNPNTTSALGFGTTSTDRYARSDFQYAVTDWISALAGGGYEKIKDPTVLTNLSGALWDVGAEYKPVERLDVKLTYGRRFNQPNWDGSVKYQFAADALLTVEYTETLQTSQSLFVNNLNFLAAGPNGTFIDTRTGQIFTAGNLPLAFANNTFIQKQFTANVQMTRGRNTYSAQAYDEQQIFQIGDTIVRTQGGGFTWARQLPRNFLLNVNLTYSHTNWGNAVNLEDGRIDNLYGVSAGLTYKMTETLQSSLSVTRTQRVSNFSQEGLSNDIVFLTVTKQF